MAAPDAIARALQIIDSDASDEAKHVALCDLEASCPGSAPVERIYQLVESLNSDVVEATLRLLAMSVKDPIPEPLLSPSFLLRLGWITASSMSSSIAKEAADLLDVFLWQSSCLQEASAGAVVLAELLADALVCHGNDSHDEVVDPCLHCLLRLLTASKDAPIVAEALLSRRDAIQALLDGIESSEYDSDRIPVLSCSILSQCLRLQTLLPEGFRLIFAERCFVAMRYLERVISLCSPMFVLPVIGALITCRNWTPSDHIDDVIAFVDSVCMCLSLSIHTSPELVHDWIAPMCILIKSVLSDTKCQTRQAQGSLTNEQDRILETARNFVYSLLENG